MNRTFYVCFDDLARRNLRNKLRRWLRQEPRRVVSVIGNGHLVHLRWQRCLPEERTTGVAVMKFRSGHDDTRKPIRNLNTTPSLVVHADGGHGFFAFVFYRCQRRACPQPLTTELL